MGKLYQKFYDEYEKLSLVELLKKFDESKKQFIKWINSLEEQVLFVENMRKWANSCLSRWPVWKWLYNQLCCAVCEFSR
ncbi:MAG: ClbS/DfsB family four-helix bundle protein [Campylobacteraceae bacterium]|nr:ClbS/DfsB family four-helix bundle protein [Campylobacteraceae bacterium]